MAEPVEELHLLLAVPPHLVALWKILNQLAHACAQLVREVWSRRPYEPVDILAGGLARGRKPNG